jgi:hypothetical protein
VNSKNEVANQALSHLGVNSVIADFDNERSPEAEVMRLFFDSSVEEVLEDFDWDFARARANLSLVEGFEDTNLSEWGYAFNLPSGCIAPRRIAHGNRNDTFDTKIPFDVEGDLLLCDLPEVGLVFTRLVTNVSKFTPAFSEALTWKLAPRLCGAENVDKQRNAAQMYLIKIDQAKVRSLQRKQRDPAPESEFMRVRD